MTTTNELNEKTKKIPCEGKEEPCDEMECHYCCGEYCGHEFDSSEGGFCINCGCHEHCDEC